MFKSNVQFILCGDEHDIPAQVIVVCVGTNNHGHTAEQVVGGIMAIVETIHSKQPQAQIIVMVRCF